MTPRNWWFLLAGINLGGAWETFFRMGGNPYIRLTLGLGLLTWAITLIVKEHKHHVA